MSGVSPEEVQQALAIAERARTDGRVTVHVVQDAPYLAVGRDVHGRAAVMLEPIVEALAFRTASVEFLPSAHLEFEQASPLASQDCTLILYDEAGLGGVVGDLMPLMCWGLLDALSRSGSNSAAAFARAMALMLRGEDSPPEVESVQGLWAELLVIAMAVDPTTLVRAWHQDPDDIYDFALGNERLEVKSSSGGHRRHHFSSSQLPPRPGLELTVVSVLVQRVAGGSTIADLVQRIRARVSPAVAADAMRKALAAVPLSGFTGVEFDAVSASASIALVDGWSVPTVGLGPGVLDITWTADLANATVGISSSGPMIGALVTVNS